MNDNKNIPQPPKWINKLLQWRLPQEQFEEVQGDMQELYSYWVEEEGVKKANRMYALNAFTFVRPLPKRTASFQTKTNHYLQANFLDMFSNHLTLAFRNLLRNKAHTLINISGLALGIACCLMVFLILRYELSFDSFHSKADRIYRVNTKFITTGGFAGGAPFR